MSNQILAISGITINQDSEGRFCLNDLHKAAGNANKHRPSLWLKNKQVIELIAEIEKAGIPAIQSKQQLGTFVVKPLVYAYAMWISPVFHLHVITAYDTMMSGYIPEHIIKAYEIIVENLPYVKPLTDTISLTEYEARKSALQQGLHDLNSVKIVLTGEELEAFRKCH